MGLVAAHALATLAIAVVLSRADAAVTALVAALCRILPRRLRVAAVDVAPPACPVPDTDVPLAASLALVARTLAAVLRSPAESPSTQHPPRPPTRPVAAPSSEITASMNSSLRRSAVRGAVVLAVTAAAALIGAGPAFAHVTAQPGQAAQGGYTVVTFRVPDESDTAGR